MTAGFAFFLTAGFEVDFGFDGDAGRGFVTERLAVGSRSNSEGCISMASRFGDRAGGFDPNKIPVRGSAFAGFALGFTGAARFAAGLGALREPLDPFSGRVLRVLAGGSGSGSGAGPRLPSLGRPHRSHQYG
ncbi:MAG TPA: hypothetical protein VN428_16505 [Bryobacteraceae bacterium]|nr:hypothetical protein [Bryobacteraceae bacterium]